jgi:hypothetical protein
MQRVTPESLAINATTSQETLSRQDIRRVALKRRGIADETRSSGWRLERAPAWPQASAWIPKRATATGFRMPAKRCSRRWERW